MIVILWFGYDKVVLILNLFGILWDKIDVVMVFVYLMR